MDFNNIKNEYVEARKWYDNNWPCCLTVDINWTCQRYDYPDYVINWIKNDITNWRKINDDNGGTYHYYSREKQINKHNFIQETKQEIIPEMCNETKYSELNYLELNEYAKNNQEQPMETEVIVQKKKNTFTQDELNRVINELNIAPIYDKEKNITTFEIIFPSWVKEEYTTETANKIINLVSISSNDAILSEYSHSLKPLNNNL